VRDQLPADGTFMSAALLLECAASKSLCMRFPFRVSLLIEYCMNAMTSGERRAVITLASLFSLRMIGLFMIMPVFAIYGRSLADSTPFLIGLAVGIYALAQALLQIPLSQLSDRIGRKRLVLAGMLLFAIGGAVAALSTNIWGVIIGRAIQGSGAISGVVMALLADLTRVEQRTKAMAAIGMRKRNKKFQITLPCLLHHKLF